MSRKLTPKIILEGTRLTLKTEIAFALNEHPRIVGPRKYRTWVRLFELLRYYSWIVDRFHISTRAYQLQAYGRACDFRWLEERLLPLGFHLVFCTRRPVRRGSKYRAIQHSTTTWEYSSASKSYCAAWSASPSCQRWSWTYPTATCPGPWSRLPTG